MRSEVFKQTHFQLTAVILILLCSSLTKGNILSDSTDIYSEYLDVKVTLSKKQVVFINFNKLPLETVKIRILDANEAVLHAEKVVDKISILKRYDISNLPKGVYSFEVSNVTFLMRKKIFKE